MAHISLKSEYIKENIKRLQEDYKAEVINNIKMDTWYYTDNTLHELFLPKAYENNRLSGMYLGLGETGFVYKRASIDPFEVNLEVWSTVTTEYVKERLFDKIKSCNMLPDNYKERGNE